MIDSMICKAYKLNKKCAIFSQRFYGNMAHENIIDEGRIIFCASYFGSNGYPQSKVWILATTTKPAYAVWDEVFKRISEGGYVNEINLDDEYYWINDHLNKEVRFCLRQSKVLTSRVLLEKHKPKEIIKNKARSIYEQMVQRRQAGSKQTLLQKLMGIDNQNN